MRHRPPSSATGSCSRPRLAPALGQPALRERFGRLLDLVELGVREALLVALQHRAEPRDLFGLRGATDVALRAVARDDFLALGVEHDEPRDAAALVAGAQLAD